ncbi:hypothetical protein [Streptomyces justiciae]|uniref:Uncharacterized protein n=1 Tax=Streptomyces justiciae TaxID=2780140 RepID=A0ABU3LLZ0_9ACTN|nr:hypothetical protein [Streptomyces justiciae]MDT7840162.1 hypothetical protein [Streptomyces justiciae]
MHTDETGGTVVMRRTNRLVTTGCLTILIALIVVFAVPVSWLWYRTWHDERVNSEREEKARASLLDRARDTASTTAHALDTSGTTDPDALTEVIWRHTEAPVITYDATRHEFTATTTKFAQYDEKAILGAGPVRVTRCLVFTYTHPSGEAWTSHLTERDDDTCRPGEEINGLARLARTRIANLPDADLTRTEVQKALSPNGRLFYDVTSVTREGAAVTVLVLISNSEATVDQCYRFTHPAMNAVPATSCSR